ncbi:MAG TPA: fibronectin type III domain-containing protein [Longimicrobium sp.]|nr:fibronectin type III domain-containing protein [Longimicrobium sp.]
MPHPRPFPRLAALPLALALGACDEVKPALPTATPGAGTSASPATYPELVLGVPLTNQSGQDLTYIAYLEYPDPTLMVRTSGGSGNASIWIRDPEQINYEDRCFSFGDPGNEEVCFLENRSSGVYLVTVGGTFAGLTVLATPGVYPSTRVLARAATMSSIEVSWEPARYATAYQVWRYDETGAAELAGTTPGNVRTLTDKGRPVNTRYRYVVEGCDYPFCSLPTYSNRAHIPTTAPLAPWGTMSYIPQGPPDWSYLMEVRWSHLDDAESEFRVLRSIRSLDGSWGPLSHVATVEPDTTTFYTFVSIKYFDAKIDPGREYRYQALACNPVGCTPGPVSTGVRVPDVIPAPRMLSGRPISAGGIWLEWKDPTANESFFELERAPVSGAGVVGSFAPVAQVRTNQVAYHDAGPGVGTYQYRIRTSYGSAGTSPWTYSNHVVVRPLPTAPAALNATALSATTVRLTWPDSGPHETYYQVYRAARNPDGGWTGYTSLATATANAWIYYSTGLTSGGTYRFQVRACNGSGCSPGTESAIVTTP